MSIGSSIGSSLGRAIGSALAGGQSYASIVTNGVLAPYVTFTRADASSCATYFDSAGVMQIAAANVPRIDYDPSTLALRGLLIEEARTNLLTYSADFSNAAWTKTDATVTPAAAVAPDGTTTAHKLVENGATAAHVVSQTAASLTSGVAYTYSAYVKPAGRDWAYIRFSATAFGSTLRAYFNAASGAVGTLSAGVTASIVPAGGGWYRISATATATATGSSGPVFASTTADATATNAGDGASGIYIWGAQFEAGTFATSYIPTTSAAVTRAADVAVVSTLANIGYNASEGTLYVEGYTAPGIGASSVNLVSLNDGTANELIALRHVTGGTTHDYTVVDGGVAQVDTAGTAVTARAVIKAAIAWKANDFAQSVNGGAAQTDASGTLPTVDRLTLGAFNGHIKTLRYYPRRLTNAELQALTA